MTKPEVEKALEVLEVMVVDDNSDFLAVIKNFLNQDGRFNVTAAVSSGSEALSSARSAAPDLVVLDLGMPGMTGLEALPLMRAAAPEAKIVVLTLLDTDSYRQAALRAGADGFVSKSALKRDLIPTLMQLAGGN